MAVTRALDVLYRWRWWTALVFAGFVAFYGSLSDRRGDPLVWVVLVLVAVLLWLPIAVRWIRSMTVARRAFRDGLQGR